MNHVVPPMCCGLASRPFTRPLLAGVVGLTLGWFVALENGRAVDVLSQHNDQWRTGSNTSETVLTPASVTPATFGKLYTYLVHGSVYAQPLYVSGLTIAGGQHNLLFVATMEDDVYAFDADTSLTYWHRQFTGGPITPVPIRDIAGRSDLNIHGNVGILSTPVIDRATSTLYLLARTKDTGNATYLQTLHALDLVTGDEKFGGPVMVHPPGFDTKTQNQPEDVARFRGARLVYAHQLRGDERPRHGFRRGRVSAAAGPGRLPIDFLRRHGRQGRQAFRHG